MSNTYYEKMEQSFPSKARIRKEQKRLADAGVKYVLSCWIDLLGVPKTKPVPLADFEPLCLGKGPQFAVGSRASSPATRTCGPRTTGGTSTRAGSGPRPTPASASASSA